MSGHGRSRHRTGWGDGVLGLEEIFSDAPAWSDRGERPSALGSWLFIIVGTAVAVAAGASVMVLGLSGHHW